MRMRHFILPLLSVATMIGASVPVEEPYIPPDIMEHLAEISRAIQHTRHVEGYLSLPAHYLAHIDKPADDLFFRALLHVHEPDTRFMLDCPRRDFRGGCFLLSPYVYEQVDAQGKRTSEKVIMSLFAHRNMEIKPVALLRLPPNDQLEVWEWVKQMATHSKQSLEAHSEHGLFNFHQLPDF
ncbi:conserved hypothetical Ustilaginaceae-specific protein [Sporisorium reilianum SRZ2]|uniref:Conserved hypothetical Ustilaginaceae-specific protein n=1 Tax=Sporisorium reilianum (strain SRZ2) TaxID=999809 RepID=E6ZS90_SPORE|nr:conserved hypothetical Ustilaginaceae-specific protein [Sporisorium reilianum SRZ2]